MLQKLHEKSEVWFALMWIIIYIVGASICDQASNSLGFQKVITLPFILILAIAMFICVKRNKWLEYYGFCKSQMPAKAFLFYIPMFIIFSINIWLGVGMRFDLTQAIVFFTYMLIVGFVEELLFRGFLFKAMMKDSVKAAVIVSSITFGLGHITNFFNGTADLFPTILQMCYAIAVGFLFVVLVWKGKSIYPCIIAHSVNNAINTFSNEAASTPFVEIVLSVILCVLCIAYTLYILWSSPKYQVKEA